MREGEIIGSELILEEMIVASGWSRGSKTREMDEAVRGDMGMVAEEQPEFRKDWVLSWQS